MHACIRTYLHTYIHMCLCVCPYVFLLVCVRICAHISTFLHVHLPVLACSAVGHDFLFTGRGKLPMETGAW